MSDCHTDWMSEAQEAMANLDPEKFAEWLMEYPTGTVEEYCDELIESLQDQHYKYREQEG